MLTPRYSVILYYPEMQFENLEYVEKCLLNGIVVHLFLKGTFLEELDLNEYDDSIFSTARENNLLYLYEEQQQLSDSEESIAVDGTIINKSLYEKICQCRDSQFNYHQYNIITASTNSNIIVVSGAGTGKTTTMINRLLYLRKTQRDFTFEKAALITFTNKASREMREKLIILLERYFKVTKKAIYLEMIDEVSKCHISTIHGFSKKLINEYGKNIGINKNVAVKSFRHERKQAVTEAINRIYKENVSLYNIIKYYPIYEVEDKLLWAWEQLDNYSIDVNSPSYRVDFGTEDKKFSSLVQKVLSYAQEILENDKEYEFEISDLMKKLAYKDLFANVGNRWSLLIVDEFQDSDNIQIEFIASFCKATHTDLIVVGDEKQSIYRFRGAEHTSFYRLKELMRSSYKKLMEFTMVRNYRTDAKLLEDINKTFINIDKRVDKFNYKQEDYIYSLVNSNTKNSIEYLKVEEYDEAVEFFNTLRTAKKEKESIAVLLRTNNDVKEFKEFCDRHSIPCRVDVSGGFFRHEAVRDFYIMLCALIGDCDNRLLYSFVSTPYINEKVDKEKVLTLSKDDLKQYLQTILESKKWTTFREKAKFENSLTLIDDIIGAFNPIKNFYKETYIVAKRNQKDYKDIAYLNTLDYKLNLEHLIFLLKDKFSENITSIYQIEEFLRLTMATDNNVDVRKLNEKDEKNFIQCLTVHKAKGLEYDYVVLPKLTNRFLNSREVDLILRAKGNSIKVGFKILLEEDEYKNDFYSSFFREENSEIIGEEARLLYVAMTRCKRKLYLNSPGIAATESINSWKSLIGGGMSGV